MKVWIMFLLLFFMPFVVGSDYIFPITYSLGDLRWCKLSGDCVLNSLTVTTFNAINTTITNQNVTGIVNAYGFSINGTPIIQGNSSFNQSLTNTLYQLKLINSSNITCAGNECWFNGTIITTHNDLSGLQGGQPNEYYHLTSDDYLVINSRLFLNGTNYSELVTQLDNGTIIRNYNITWFWQHIMNGTLFLTTQILDYPTKVNLLTNLTLYPLKTDMNNNLTLYQPLLINSSNITCSGNQCWYNGTTGTSISSNNNALLFQNGSGIQKGLNTSIYYNEQTKVLVYALPINASTLGSGDANYFYTTNKEGTNIYHSLGTERVTTYNYTILRMYSPEQQQYTNPCYLQLMYGKDTSNPTSNAIYLGTNAECSTQRIFITGSPYAFNFGGTQRFENFPALVVMSGASGTPCVGYTCSAIQGANGRKLVLDAYAWGWSPITVSNDDTSGHKDFQLQSQALSTDIHLGRPSAFTFDTQQTTANLGNLTHSQFTTNNGNTIIMNISSNGAIWTKDTIYSKKNINTETNYSASGIAGITASYNCTSYPNVTITGGIITYWSC